MYPSTSPLYLRYISPASPHISPTPPPPGEPRSARERPHLPTSPPHISPINIPYQESALVTDVITAEGGAQHGQVHEVYTYISPVSPVSPLYLPIPQQVHEVYEVNDGYTSR